MRFVVLHHTAWPGRTDHYDLMLQFAEGGNDDDRVLATYATSDDRFPAPGCVLTRIEDHRRIYLTYEGPVSGNRGQVSRVDSGEVIYLSNSQNEFELRGRRLSGKFRLVPTGTIFCLEKTGEVSRH